VADNFALGAPGAPLAAVRRIRAQIRSWRLHLRSARTLKELAREINTVARGWINHYGRFRRSTLHPSLNRINDYRRADRGSPE
jgi:RNA-directed DNA polymerase